MNAFKYIQQFYWHFYRINNCIPNINDLNPNFDDELMAFHRFVSIKMAEYHLYIGFFLYGSGKDFNMRAIIQVLLRFL